MTTAPPVAQPLPFRFLLDEAVRQARPRFKKIYPPVAIPLALVAGAVPLAQLALFRGMAAAGQSTPSLAAALLGAGGFLLAMVVFLAVYGLSYGTMLAAAVDAVAGREVSMVHAWRLVLRPAVLGTLLLTSVAVGLGFFLCILPGIYLGLLFSLVVPVMADERVFGTSALRRSAELVRYNPQRALEADPRLKVFLIVFVGTLIGYVVSMMVQLPLIVMQQVLMFRDVAGGQKADPEQMMMRMTWMQVPSQIIGMLTSTAVHLYVCFGLALLFFDVKQRKEGLDLEGAIARLFASRRGEPPPGGAPPAPPPVGQLPP